MMKINTLKQEQKDEREGKIIRKPQIAREILKRGGDSVRIIDLKRDRFDPTGQRTVFIFEDTEEFQKIFQEVLNDNEEYKKTRTDGAFAKKLEDLESKLDAFLKLQETNKE